MTNFHINYLDDLGASYGIDLHLPYPNDATGNLSFNVSNFSFRSGNYDSYIDDINDENIQLIGYEDNQAMTKLTALGLAADGGFELIITSLGSALDGVYIINRISYKPIGLDVFEYQLNLKFVHDVIPWSFCLPACFNLSGNICGGI